MVEEAGLVEVGSGLAPESPGWFVVNARDAAWVRNDAFGGRCTFESGPRVLVDRPDIEPQRFPETGFTLAVLQPGKPSGMYHAESCQEDFLVLAGDMPARDRGGGARAAYLGLRPLPGGHSPCVRRHGRRAVRAVHDRRAAGGKDDRVPRLGSRRRAWRLCRGGDGRPGRGLRAGHAVAARAAGRGGAGFPGLDVIALVAAIAVAPWTQPVRFRPLPGWQNGASGTLSSSYGPVPGVASPKEATAWMATDVRYRDPATADPPNATLSQLPRRGIVVFATVYESAAKTKRLGDLRLDRARRYPCCDGTYVPGGEYELAGAGPGGSVCRDRARLLRLAADTRDADTGAAGPRSPRAAAAPLAGCNARAARDTNGPRSSRRSMRTGTC